MISHSSRVAAQVEEWCETQAAGRLNTLGAILYRAGRFEDAIRQLGRSVEVHDAEGMRYDAVFLAMAHHRLGHADEARRWLRPSNAVDPITMRNPGAGDDPSWLRRLEIELLRREATNMIEPIHP